MDAAKPRDRFGLTQQRSPTGTCKNGVLLFCGSIAHGLPSSTVSCGAFLLCFFDSTIGVVGLRALRRLGCLDAGGPHSPGRPRSDGDHDWRAGQPGLQHRSHAGVKTIFHIQTPYNPIQIRVCRARQHVASHRHNKLLIEPSKHI